MSRILAPVAVAIGVALFFWGTPFWWIGAGLVAGGIAAGALSLRGWLSDAWESLGGSRRIGPFTFDLHSTLKDTLGLAIITTVGTALVFPTFTGDAPVSADHPVHMFRAWTLKEMAFDGRFYSWSHEWFAGYPAQFLYPIGGDLWVNAIWLATLGLVSLYTAYAIAIWSMFCLQGVAVYLMCRRDVGRIAGVLAGLFVLGDDGAFRLGGWVFGMHWGVWPQNFATFIACLAVWQLRDVLVGDKRRNLAFFAFFMGASIFTHPLIIIFWAAALPIAAFAVITTREDLDRLRSLARLALGSVVGGIFAGFWLLPFLSARDFSEGYGVAWMNSFGLGEGIYDGTIFSGTWSTAVILGGFVLFGWLVARRVMPTFFAAMGFALVVGASTDLITGFHLLEISDAFGFLQFVRFPVLAKPFWFVAAAFGLVTLVGSGPRLVDEFRGRVSDSDPELAQTDWSNTLLLRVSVLGIFIAPLLFGWIVSLKSDQFSRGLREQSERSDLAERARLRDFINEEAEGIDGIARVGIDMGHDEHSMHDWQIGLDVPLYKIGYTPAETFVYKMEQRNPELLEQTNVKWVVTHGKSLPKRHFEHLQDFGRYKVYRFKDWRPDPFTVDGAEQDSVALTSWGPERIELQAGAEASGQLTLHVSHFDRWNAYRNGEPVDIQVTHHPREPARTGFMTVELEPGTYTFVWEAKAPEYLAWLCLLLALLAFILLVVSDLRRTPGPQIAALFERAADFGTRLDERVGTRWPVIIGIASTAAVLVLGGLAAWKPPQKPISEPTSSDVVWDIANDLESANVGLERDSKREPCVEVLGRHMCGDAMWEHVFATFGIFRDDDWRRCVWAHPHKNRVLAIDVDDVPIGSRLVGYYGITSTGASRRPTPVEFRIATDGMVVFEGETKRDKRVYPVDVPLEGDESFDLKIEVEAENTGRRHFCFMLQVVE